MDGTRLSNSVCCERQLIGFIDDLTEEVGLEYHQLLEPSERTRLCAELDGLIALLYGLTESEFACVLTTTFPLVAETVKVGALDACRNVKRGLVK